jgi:hypothetical protein
MRKHKRTRKQAEAARRNGAKSRGPVTPEGKDRSSRNAITHGLDSRVLVLRNESTEAYERMLADYLNEFQPETRRERDLVGDIVTARWRLNRVITLETAGIDFEIDRQRPELTQTSPELDESTRAHLAVTALTDSGRTLTWYSRHEARLRRAVERATAQLRYLQSARENFRNEPEPAPHNLSTP